MKDNRIAGPQMTPKAKQPPHTPRKRTVPESANANADAILDAAEELFSRKGFAAVSMRAIAAESGQHLASANYYFGSKNGLFEAAFLRRIVPVNKRRIALLHKQGTLTLDKLVDAYIRPLYERDDPADSVHKARIIMLFSKQVLSDPEQNDYLLQYYDDVSRAFITAIQQTIPGISLADATWGYSYMVGILVFTLAGRSPVARTPNDILAQLPPEEDDEKTIDRLKRFICAGLKSLPRARK